MQSYTFTSIEQKWQSRWKAAKAASDHSAKQPDHMPTYYILNMFPYPSGSGLHVGHHTGYVASDIIARYYKHKGYHVLNPMGFDAFGLPAEQYAIQTGQHPARTTAENIQKYREQLDQVALDFNWECSINTSDPSYYKWTQWIFLQLFNAWYNLATDQAEPIANLIQLFTQHGNKMVQAACDSHVSRFSAEEWLHFSETTQQKILLHYRLAYLKESMVNWCEALGTVLSNEEVKDGVSERGGHPVIRKKMQQWSLRMTAYADRLLAGLEVLDWPASTKEIQRHWIGRSEGAEILFKVAGDATETFTVFSTRPETVFGVSFIAIAPEHPWAIKTAESTGNQKLLSYIQAATNRSDQSRLASATHLSGIYSGCAAIHPFTGEMLPIWVADYILPHYGSGAVMGVPAHDKRDYLFAETFDLPILPVIESAVSMEQLPYEGTQGRLIHAQFLNGLSVEAAFQTIIEVLIKEGIGRKMVHYKLQDPIFSRQRYWGEPLPIYYKADGLPYALSAEALPLCLPKVSSYLPNKSGAPPLSNATNWVTSTGDPLELTTMPGWAGSSWYFLRYMDAHNRQACLDSSKEAYWKRVNLYIGGSEHATGHLLYARFWTKVLYDLGHIQLSEPFPKLFHQGMVQHRSAMVYRLKEENTFVSLHLKEQYDVVSLYIPIAFVKNQIVDIEALKNWRPEYAAARFIMEDGRYICGQKIEKISKSKHNVVNPDAVIQQYGADALRLYLMFLGPLSQTKPWEISGIEGIARFLQKVWRLVHQAKNAWDITQPKPTSTVLATLHRTIQKVEADIQNLAFNTAISSLMICVNSLMNEQLPQIVIESFLILLHPFAPYITSELWEHIGRRDAIEKASFPVWDGKYLMEEEVTYPVAINGKVRTNIVVERHTPQEALQAIALADTMIQKWLKDQIPKKVLVVPNRMINIVL